METKIKWIYESPVCETVEVEIAAVICDSGSRSMGLDGSGGSKNVEDRESYGTWGGDDGWK